MTAGRETVHQTEGFQSKLSGAPSRQGWGGGDRASGTAHRSGVVPAPADTEVPCPEIWRGPRPEVAFVAEMLLLPAHGRPSHTRGCVLAEVMLDSVVLEMRGWRWWKRRRSTHAHRGRQRTRSSRPFLALPVPPRSTMAPALPFLTRTLTFETNAPVLP